MSKNSCVAAEKHRRCVLRMARTELLHYKLAMHRNKKADCTSLLAKGGLCKYTCERKNKKEEIQHGSEVCLWNPILYRCSD